MSRDKQSNNPDNKIQCSPSPKSNRTRKKRPKSHLDCWECVCGFTRFPKLPPSLAIRWLSLSHQRKVVLLYWEGRKSGRSVSLNKRMPTRLFKRNKVLTCGKYFWATLIDAQQLKKNTMSSRRGTRGSGPPEEMIKRLKDEQMRRETLRQLRARNALVGASILAVMGGIYLYTLRATRQENFLDKEFDTPGAGVQRSNQPSKN